MSAPDRLKTGLLDVVDDDDSALAAMQDRLLALVVLLVKKSATTAGVFCQHAGIPVVGVDQIRAALKFESMKFFDSPDLEAETEAMLARMEDWDVSLSDESVNDAVVSIIDDVEDEIRGERVVLECECEVCRGMREIDAQWASYQPDDEAKLFLKRQMDTLDALYERGESLQE
ncbi:MAG: hypothetical protein ACO35C_05260 [Pontimonas sp.]